MASGGERRMLFDIRGRRKHVIRVVYAILAVLMGASLFLVVGPVNIGSLIGSSTSTGDATKLVDERAERLEAKLRKNPKDEAAQLALIRTRISAAQAAAGAENLTQGQPMGAKTREEFEAATAAWERYAEQAGAKASPTTAQLMATTYYSLAVNPGAPFDEAFENLVEAANVQEIYAKAKPSASSYTTLAIFQLLVGNFKDGEASQKQAEGLAATKQQRKEVAKTLNEAKKQGKQNLKAKKEVAKLEKGKGKESIENPLGGLGGAETGVLPGG